MKVIGAGFGRTGTMSTQAALEALGYPCYHMKTILIQWKHLRAWYDFVTNKSTMDWKDLLKDYEATVDFPTCLYYKELMEDFPNAKVLLNVRDPNSWIESWTRNWNTRNRFRAFRLLVPRLWMFHKIADVTIFDGLFGGKLDRKKSIEIFSRHIEEVKAYVPSERLLVFNVKDGWEPLCRFLECDVPSDKPFPLVNEGTSTIVRLFTNRVARDMLKPWAMVPILMLIALFIWWLNS